MFLNSYVAIQNNFYFLLWVFCCEMVCGRVLFSEFGFEIRQCNTDMKIEKSTCSFNI